MRVSLGAMLTHQVDEQFGVVGGVDQQALAGTGTGDQLYVVFKRKSWL